MSAIAGDVLGWYDVNGGAIGYEIDHDILFPTIMATGQSPPSTTEGSNSMVLEENAMELVHRAYGVTLCYSRLRPHSPICIMYVGIINSERIIRILYSL